MILTAHRHGRTPSARAGLAAHLAATAGGQTVRLVRVRGSVATDLPGVVADFARLRALSRTARTAVLHVSVNPGRPWGDDRRDAAVATILSFLGAERHAHALVEHADKPRARGGCGNVHYHVVVAHVGPDGRALNSRLLYARLEAARALIEVRFEEQLTPSRRTDLVAELLRASGHEDIAASVEAIRPPPDALPRSGLTAATRGRLARAGLSAPILRARVLAAYASGDDRAAVAAELAEADMALEAGEKPGIWIVRAGGLLIGALDRLVARPRDEVAAFMAKPAAAPERGPVSKSEAEPPSEPMVPTDQILEPCLPASPPRDVGAAASPKLRPQAPALEGAGTYDPADRALRHAYRIWLAHIEGDAQKRQAELDEVRRGPDPPPSRRRERRAIDIRCDEASAAVSDAEKALQDAEIDQARRVPGFRRRLRDAVVRLWGRSTPAPPEIVEARTNLAAARARRDDTLRIRSEFKHAVAAEQKAYADAVKRDASARELAERRLETDLARLRDWRYVLECNPRLVLGGAEAIEAAVTELRRLRVDGPRAQASVIPGDTLFALDTEQLESSWDDSNAASSPPRPP